MGVDQQFIEKYEESGRVGNWLIDNFYDAVLALANQALPVDTGNVMPRVLEMGCGAGFSTQRLHGGIGTRVQLEACDIGRTLARRAQQLNPRVPVTVRSVYDHGFDDKSFDLTFLLEVLEHLEDPEAALEQMRRITKSWMILSTPREPIWRALNMARFKYIKDLGNTPGHIQHWSSRELRKTVSAHFEIVSQRTPLPWTILLLRPRQ